MRTLQQAYLILLACSLTASGSNAFTTTPSSAFFPRTTTLVSQRSSKTISVRGGGGGGVLGMGPSEAWGAYNDALEASPLLVKSLTAGVILGAADLAGQAFEKRDNEDADSKVDVGRAVRFATFGLVLQAPWNHFYYNILDGVLPPTADPFTATTGIKTVIDQFVQAPIFTVLIFAFLGALEGKNLEQIKNQLDEDYKETIIANCKC